MTVLSSMRPLLAAVFAAMVAGLALGTASALPAVDVITTVAGNGGATYNGDGVSATLASIANPFAVAVDAAGNLYIADELHARIRKVDTSGTITTIAGYGVGAYGGDGGSATAAAIDLPMGVAVDSAGDVYIADTGNNRVREISATSGIITTIAGNGTAGYSGEGTATAVELNQPIGVAFDAAGNLYIADQGNNRVRKVTGTTISTVAGTGVSGFSGDGASATAAQLSAPQGLAFDSAGDLFIADGANNRVRRISATGAITTYAGMGATLVSGDGGSATAAGVPSPFGLAVDARGDVFVADEINNVVREITFDGVITTVAGTGTYGYSGDGGAATLAGLANPTGIAIAGSGRLLIADSQNNVIRGVVFGPAPVVTSAASATGNLGVTFTYQITASNTPTTYFASGLPAGLSINTATGLISGNPTVFGNFPVIVHASNGGGTGALTVSMIISGTAPVISSASSYSLGVGGIYAYTIAATNNPTTFSAAPLPPGASLSATSGVISGIATTVGTTVMTVTATNAAGSGTAAVTVTVQPAGVVPVITSPTAYTVTTGAAFTYQITATNSPTSYSASNIPSGVSLSSTTGLFSGEGIVAGAVAMTVTATNASGSGSQIVQVTISGAGTGTGTATGGGSTGFVLSSGSTPSGGGCGLGSGLGVMVGVAFLLRRRR
jgi:sugar lactone lactonase YvrE